MKSKRKTSKRSRRQSTCVTGANGDQYPRILYAPPSDALENVADKPESIPNLSDVTIVDEVRDEDDSATTYEIGVYKLVGVHKYRAVTPPTPPMKVTRVK